MKTKKRTPVFSIVVLRVLEIRFKEIMNAAIASDKNSPGSAAL
jgi:hypothetical protein